MVSLSFLTCHRQRTPTASPVRWALCVRDAARNRALESTRGASLPHQPRATHLPGEVPARALLSPVFPEGRPWSAQGDPLGAGQHADSGLVLTLGVGTLERAWGVHDRATIQGWGGRAAAPTGAGLWVLHPFGGLVGGGTLGGSPGVWAAHRAPNGRAPLIHASPTSHTGRTHSCPERALHRVSVLNPSVPTATPVHGDPQPGRRELIPLSLLLGKTSPAPTPLLPGSARGLGRVT